MIEKFNKIYTIFNRDVVKSNNRRINAIQGYGIENKGIVGGYEDVNAWFTRAKKSFPHIETDKMYLFTNPASGECWYVGKHILAYCNEKSYVYKDFPRITAFVWDDDVIVTSFDTIQKYKPLFSNSSVRRIAIAYDIGCLSTPHRATVNGNLAFNPIRLPYVV